MAVWSEVLYSRIPDDLRFEAEYFQPKYLQMERQLSALQCNNINELSEFVRSGPFGSNLLKDNYVEDGVVVLRPFNIKDATVEQNNLVFITEEERTKLGLTAYRAGDIAFARVGDIGCGIIPDYNNRPITISPNIILSRLKVDSINPVYLAVFMSSRLGSLQMERAMKVVAQPTITVDAIKSLLVPIVSHDAQKEVAGLFHASTAKRDESQRLYAEAEALLLSELCLDTLDLSHQLCYEANFRETQDVKRLDAEYFQPHVIRLLEYLKARNGEAIRNFADVLSGYAWKSEYFRDNTEEGEPFIRIRDCKPGQIDTSMLTRLDSYYVAKEKATTAKAGDLTVGMDGLDYFYAAMVSETCYVNQRVCHVSMKDESPFSPEYVMLVINSIFGQTHLLREMTIAQTVGHITNEDVRNLVVPKIESMSEITKKIRQSHDARQEAKTLLETAKRRVETLITNG